MRTGKKIGLYVLAGLFILAGTMHFVSPETYLKIMPPYLPWHGALVLISGIFEVLLGILLLPTSTRKVAVYGLILLLLAVFPANIYMATTGGAEMSDSIWFSLIAWGRLPLQFLLIAWVYSYRK
ncbi:MAG TPA: DoxX family protein [Bacteroidetes bacterium]|nr:DoxX family protein [Bacteroidota bacterium]